MSRILILVLILGLLFILYWYYDKILGDDGVFSSISMPLPMNISPQTKAIVAVPLASTPITKEEKKPSKIKKNKHNLDFIDDSENFDTDKSVITHNTSKDTNLTNLTNQTNISLNSLKSLKSNDTDYLTNKSNELTFGLVGKDDSNDDMSVSDLL